MMSTAFALGPEKQGIHQWAACWGHAHATAPPPALLLRRPAARTANRKLKSRHCRISSTCKITWWRLRVYSQAVGQVFTIRRQVIHTRVPQVFNAIPGGQIDRKVTQRKVLFIFRRTALFCE